MAEARSLSTGDRRRLDGALRTIERLLGGSVDFRTVVGTPELAQKVQVPADEATWIVIGEWGDGTFDIVREQGSFSSDSMVGWRPGQTIQDYRSELDEIPPEPVKHASRSTPPLFRPRVVAD